MPSLRMRAVVPAAEFTGQNVVLDEVQKRLAMPITEFGERTATRASPGTYGPA